MSKSATVNSNDIKVNNSKFRDYILSNGAYLLSRSRVLIWYLETLVLSSRFQQLLRSQLWGHSSRRYGNRYLLWQRELQPRISTGAEVYEFGVASGTATRWWADRNLNIKSWQGFDTFTGLPTPWTRGGVAVMDAGVFDQREKSSIYPKVKSKFQIVWHQGLISETLNTERIEVSNEAQKVIFIDVDLYEPTKEILRFFSSKLSSGDLIYFDEGFDPWNEGLALRECMGVIPSFRAVAHTGSALLLEVV